MSFIGYKKTIEPMDTVILYISNNLHAIVVQEMITNKHGVKVENVFQTAFGALNVKDLIGVEYGSRVELSRGWGHVLQPTPELWTLCLPHRTQIIYSPDISMLLNLLDLGPGKIVLEAGTGSGSLTHALIRRVKPTGFVHTFDFHPQRVILAQKEFELHNVNCFVSAKCRDVLSNGFGEELISKADAVFLDLPRPWLGVPWAKHTLRYDKGGRFASFSPCIEQVQKTNAALMQEGFKDIVTVEVLQTELKVQERNVAVRDLTFLKERSSANPVNEKAGSSAKFLSGTWPHTTPGHTGYMTFATLPPDLERHRLSLTAAGLRKVLKTGKVYLANEGRLIQICGITPVITQYVGDKRKSDTADGTKNPESGSSKEGANVNSEDSDSSISSTDESLLN